MREAVMQAEEHILSDKLLHQFGERAGTYDRENRFFHEDFDDLRDAGYLRMPVPKELGGAGFNGGIGEQQERTPIRQH